MNYNVDMILYIDETENEEYFIVAGLLAESEDAVKLAYKKFKKSVSKHPLSDKVKQNVFLEFKSTLIDSGFQRIKKKMLQEIKAIDGVVVYSCYVKKHKSMKQLLKQSVYITLLSNILNSIDYNIDVIFDEFRNSRFEGSIITAFNEFDNVNSIKPFDSQLEPGLQFADNICSTIRRHLSGTDDMEYYSIIEAKIQEV